MEKQKNTDARSACWQFVPKWIASLWCAIFGHDVHREIWECNSYEYWTPEIDERFWCKRCDKDL